jgi:hypothetical protein
MPRRTPHHGVCEGKDAVQRVSQRVRDAVERAVPPDQRASIEGPQAEGAVVQHLRSLGVRGKVNLGYTVKHRGQWCGKPGICTEAQG